MAQELMRYSSHLCTGIPRPEFGRVLTHEEVCSYLAYHDQVDLMIYRYFLFLLVNVVFIFLLASTYWQLVRDLANSPAKIPEKLAQALQMGSARSGVYWTTVETPALIYN